MSIDTIKTDYLIVGSGVAGLNAAFHASKLGSVVLLTKANRDASSSYWAQGGVAAVLKGPDTYSNHIRDTLAAGRNYCNTDAVDVLVKEGARQVKNLIELGMPFDKTGHEFSLGLEGGHSERRILHANGAATGKVLVDFLNKLIDQTPAVNVIEHAFVFDLVADKDQNRCYGADVFLYQEKRQVRIESKSTILATGGYSGLFSRTTNPHTSTGDGLWLAYNHGTVLKDLEFIQFHPTAFFTKSGEAFLISEALRGDGARLLNSAGERFMENYEQKELAPRDVVAKEIFRQIQNSKEDFVYLDVRHLDIATLKQKFPALLSKIERQGVNIEKEGIPVAPAAHYCIGGIETGLHGQTGVRGLYACGEAAAIGVHGANRLASNSLLECLVFSCRAAEHAGQNTPGQEQPEIPVVNLQVNEGNKKVFQQLKKETAALLNTFAGIEREAAGLKKANRRIDGMLNSLTGLEENDYYSIRLKGMLNVADHIILSALERQESRGVHTRLDFPETDDNELKPYRFEKPSLEV